MELCVPQRWPSPCSTGLLLIAIIVVVSLLVGMAVRRLCCQRRPIGHAAEEEMAVAVVVEDQSKDFISKFMIRTFAVAAQPVLEHDNPKSIPPTMVRSPGASPEPARSRCLRSQQATPLSPSVLSVPGSQDSSSTSLDPLGDFSLVSQRSLKEFSYTSLVGATRSFDSRNELGRGSSGVLYTGDLVLDDGINTEVAIKMFHNITDSKQVREDLRQKKYFLQHRNLVALYGYCLHEGRLYLVYHRMHYYSLDYKLFDEEGAAAKPVLTLAQCYSIIKDVAQGLYQLHKCQIFHGAVKASNVMLEPCSSGFRARLSDFRYSKLLIEHASDLTTTLESLMLCQKPPDAPQRTTLPSLETDMLHFGGFVLEIVCGRRLSDRDGLPARYSSLVEWVWGLDRGRRLHAAVNESLKKAGDFDSVQANGLLRLGLHCSHPDPMHRSTIGNVLLKLAALSTEDTVEPIMVRQIRKNVSGTKRLVTASL